MWIDLNEANHPLKSSTRKVAITELDPPRRLEGRLCNHLTNRTQLPCRTSASLRRNDWPRATGASTGTTPHHHSRTFTRRLGANVARHYRLGSSKASPQTPVSVPHSCGLIVPARINTALEIRVVARFAWNKSVTNFSPQSITIDVSRLLRDRFHKEDKGGQRRWRRVIKNLLRF